MRRHVYAVTTGDYVGEFLVYMDADIARHTFLSLPDMKIRRILKSDVVEAFNNGILEEVEKLPSDVYSLCCEQYRNNDKNPGTDDNVHSNTPSDT
jgi:hypothetical protein